MGLDNLTYLINSTPPALDSMMTVILSVQSLLFHSPGSSMFSIIELFVGVNNMLCSSLRPGFSAVK
jgi:hypothetical protein